MYFKKKTHKLENRRSTRLIVHPFDFRLKNLVSIIIICLLTKYSVSRARDVTAWMYHHPQTATYSEDDSQKASEKYWNDQILTFACRNVVLSLFLASQKLAEENSQRYIVIQNF